MKINKAVYENARGRACLSNAEVARAAKIRAATLCRAVNGGNSRVETIGKIAKALKMDYEDLIVSE